jgi:membrane-associated phospholipid phosphatase
MSDWSFLSAAMISSIGTSGRRGHIDSDVELHRPAARSVPVSVDTVVPPWERGRRVRAVNPADRQHAVSRRTGGQLWLASVLMFAVVAVLGVRVHDGNGPLHVDRAASRVVESGRFSQSAARGDHAAASARAELRDIARYQLPVAAGAASLVLAFLAWRRRDPKGAGLCLVAPTLAVVLVEVVVKPLVGRHHGAGLAYPSGHATGAAAVAALGLVLGHRWGGWRAAFSIAPLALALPAAMGLLVLWLGWHYPTDVVGGTAMGFGTVLAVAAALARGRPTDAGPTAREGTRLAKSAP